MKKLSLLFLILALCSQAAFAVIPLLVAGARVVSAGLKTTAGQDLAIGSALGIGLIFAELNWNRTGTNGSTQKSTLYYTNTARPPSALESAAGFTAGYPSVVPPSSGGSPTTMYSWNGNLYATPEAVCDAGLVSIKASYGSTAYYIYSNLSCAYRYTSSSGDFPITGLGMTTVFSCLAGYTVSGSTCILSNSAAVPRPVDGHCPINRSGNTYTSDPSDPDCIGANASPSFAADGSFSVTGADGTTISSSPTATAGERKITYSSPDSARNVTKVREVYAQDGATPASPAIVTGVSDKEIAGTGSAATGAPVASPGTTADNSGIISAIRSAQISGDAAINADTAAVGAAIAADTASREAWNAGEAARTAADRVADRVVPPIEEIPKQTIPFTNTPVPFASAASCPAPIAFSMLGRSYSIHYDPMCTVMSTLRPLFLALGAFGAAAIFIGGLKA